jgi:undecaprenyl-diphosphatase
MGLERAVVVRFSFLLGIPARTLAGLVEFKGVLDQINTSELIPLAIGVISSADIFLSFDRLVVRLSQKTEYLGFCLVSSLFRSCYPDWCSLGRFS